ncbi:CATRA conflict system CASPASE/TPR repeat-associated protein [Frankia sp. CiP3]|uniref:CATRA conflict system CASPASE/TPR repeat-associated protein n=1 Tax=Frankia sp. CiP3 TaxID=2880971 RepID=UPI001EF43421|nr:CATRA conflict system CASPASE/TPR repeat-associated protein [Frankia sp. CiP3]
MPDSSVRLLVAPELAVHVFAPTGGPHAEDLYVYLRHLWQGCRDQFGMKSSIITLGVPPNPPQQHQPDATRVQAGLAAQRHTGSGVFQSLLRREHDVLCLSVMLAPPPEAGVPWTELSRMWVQVSEPVPDGLLGTAELHLARLADPEQGRVEPTATLGAACRELLPAPAPHPDFDTRGTATAGGFAVWEADCEEEARLRRRIVVVAAHDRDAELSSWTWTWTRGGAHGLTVTPFAKYLMHAAKLRYHLRVWAGGAPVRALRRDADRAVAGAAGLLDDSRQDAASASPHDAGQCLAVLRREEYRLATAAADLREMRRSVEVATANMAGYACPAPSRDAQPGAGGDRGLFADDRGLASWFASQLDDDHFYLATALDRVRDTLGTAAALTGVRAAERPGGQAFAPGEDVVLTGLERVSLLQELARTLPTDAAAETVLSLIGFGREGRPNLDMVSPRSGWAEILDECDHGAVRAPYRRILAAALARYPHNTVFRELAQRHGIEVPEFDDPASHRYPPPTAGGLSLATSRESVINQHKTKGDYMREVDARGEGQAVLTVLDTRGVHVPEGIREEILACTDLAQLGTWLRRAVTVSTAEEVTSP